MSLLQIITFAGIEIDTIVMEARLPHDKLVKCWAATVAIQVKHLVTLKQLQSLIGLLGFACGVVVPGRACLWQLINLTIGVPCPHFHIRLNAVARADLTAWCDFLHTFNGKSLLRPNT